MSVAEMANRANAERLKVRLQDHSWYQILRGTYPDDDECWIWPGGQQVTSSVSFGMNGKAVSVRPYIKAIWDDEEYNAGWKASEDCISKWCVNPEHQVRKYPDQIGPIGVPGSPVIPVRAKAAAPTATVITAQYAYLEDLLDASCLMARGASAQRLQQKWRERMPDSGKVPWPISKQHWDAGRSAMEQYIWDGSGPIADVSVLQFAALIGAKVIADTLPDGVEVPDRYAHCVVERERL